MQIKADENFAKCGCGRSPTGKCIGWHALPESEYQSKLESYMAEEQVKDDALAEYQKQAQEIWSDSCTTPRKTL
jgi:uncharacterized protein YfcZ (UPF0381/DUF406 family)